MNAWPSKNLNESPSSQLLLKVLLWETYAGLKPNYTDKWIFIDSGTVSDVLRSKHFEYSPLLVQAENKWKCVSFCAGKPFIDRCIIWNWDDVSNSQYFGFFHCVDLKG